MHPQIRQPEQGQCPICGMDLIPAGSGGDDLSTEEVELSARARTKARIQTTRVERGLEAGVERRLLGRVDYDETTLRVVTSWIAGRIDALHVRVTGQRVAKGQKIATLYSPEVYSAHQDLIQARQQVQRFGAASTDTARRAGQSALDAARARLRLLGVPTAELNAMEKASSPTESTSIRTPFSGTVIERLATEGAYVRAGTGLYRVADLRRIWVQLDAYESDLPLLRLGQGVELEVSALPGDTFSGTVTFVDPVLDARTRTARVRIEVSNKDRSLAPGMFAEAIVKGREEGGEQPLLIPESAPLFTGRRSLVYVERRAEDRYIYEARVVRLGARVGEYYPVIAGLGEGERIVTHGAFAIDADLQIRAGSSMMTVPDDTETGPYDDVTPVPKEYEVALGQVLEHYLALHRALASDDLAAAKGSMQKAVTATEKLHAKGPGAFADGWQAISRQLLVHGKHLGHASTLDEARLPFRDVSQQIATLLRVFGNPLEDTVHLAFCPMALNNEGAEWVQRSATIENPYFGASMHRCGEVHNAVVHGSYLPAKGGSQEPPRAAPAGGHNH
jgi:Cu(I)/Ag(I) efflux system membrane fusion protein